MQKIRMISGFSIELRGNFKLILDGKYKGLNLYECIGGYISDIAIVNKPATKVGTIIEEGNKVAQIKIEGNDQLYNAFQSKITGPVMIPNKKILRNKGINGIQENCYWYFSESSIKNYEKKYDETRPLKNGH